jgi:hypothetical protein
MIFVRTPTSNNTVAVHGFRHKPTITTTASVYVADIKWIPVSVPSISSAPVSKLLTSKSRLNIAHCFCSQLDNNPMKK